MCDSARFGFPLEAKQREEVLTGWDELKQGKRSRRAVLRNNDPPRLFRFGNSLHFIGDGAISVWSRVGP